jgi:hypothetical protein
MGGVPNLADSIGIFGMTSHEGRDKTAGRLDLEAALSRIVEGGAHQKRSDTLAFIRGRNLGVGEDQPIALLDVNRNGKAVFRFHFVASERSVMRNRHRVSPFQRRPCRLHKEGPTHRRRPFNQYHIETPGDHSAIWRDHTRSDHAWSDHML